MWQADKMLAFLDSCNDLISSLGIQEPAGWSSAIPSPPRAALEVAPPVPIKSNSDSVVIGDAAARTVVKSEPVDEDRSIGSTITEARRRVLAIRERFQLELRCEKAMKSKLVAKKLRDEGLFLPSGIIGHIPGVEIGDVFLCRDEMRLLGVFWESEAGIAVAPWPVGDFSVAAAVLIEKHINGDNLDLGERVIFPCHGGVDQKLALRKNNGDRALEKSMEQCSPVRVIRGFTLSLYRYDGLYLVKSVMVEPGGTLRKFILERIRGQAPLQNIHPPLLPPEFPRARRSSLPTPQADIDFPSAFPEDRDARLEIKGKTLHSPIKKPLRPIEEPSPVEESQPPRKRKKFLPLQSILGHDLSKLSSRR